jgi:hypothetical protein
MKIFKRKKVIARENGFPVLIRWNLFECRYFSIKIHKICSSDYACMHDHPWAFISFIFKGGYVEHTPDGATLYGAPSVLYRPSRFIHRLEIYEPAWTIVVSFKKVRQWGFWTASGWIAWFKYSPSKTCE